MITNKISIKGIRLIFQQAKQLLIVLQKKQLQIIIGILSVFLFSSCQEYLAASVALAVIPEILFGIFIVVIIIIAIIGGIIHLITGGDK